MFICHKNSLCSTTSKLAFSNIDHLFSFVTKVHIVPQIKSCIFLITIKFVQLLQKFTLFTHIKVCFLKYLSSLPFCYKSSLCSPKLKFAFTNIYHLCSFVAKVHYVYPYQSLLFQRPEIFFLLLQKFNMFTQIESTIFIIDN